MSDHPTEHKKIKRDYPRLLLDIKKHRKYIAEFEEFMKAPGDVEQLSTQLFLNDQTKIDVEIFRPIDSKLELLPTIFHIPGSGFNTLNPHFAYITCSQLAVYSSCQVIVINHVLAPENLFPKGQESALEVFHTLMKAALNEPQKLNTHLKIDVNNIALSGYSSGGTFAAWIANQDNRYTSYIKHLFLISPMVDFSGKMPRPNKELERHDTMSQDVLDSMKEYYLYGVKQTDLTDHKLSPFFQTIKKNHPPTHFLRGQFDRLTSDTTMYAKKLATSTTVTLKTIPKIGHIAFWFEKEAILDISHLARQAFGLFALMPLINTKGDKFPKTGINLPIDIIQVIYTYLTALPKPLLSLMNEDNVITQASPAQESSLEDTKQLKGQLK